MRASFLRLLVATLLLAATPAVAAETFDLSPYLVPPSTPGDFRVFARSDGGQRRQDLLGVEPWEKGWRSLVRETVSGTGTYDATALFEGFLIPGKQLLDGNLVHSSGLAIVFRKPAKSLKLRATLGKVQRIKQKGQLLLDGTAVASALRFAGWVADAFETVATPSGVYPGALRARALTIVGFVNRRAHAELIEVDELTLWYAPGRGLVARTIDLSVFDNGVMIQSDDWDEELVSGSVLGVPFP